MEFQRPQYCLFFVLLGLLSCYSQAYVFYAGGRDGWVLNPSEDYNHWAGRNRFQVNDTIVFKYSKGSNSVLVVNKDDYDKCNTNNPIKKFEDGDTQFKFDRSGPFYFISGQDGNCAKGQKLIVVVLAVRGPKPQYPPPPSVSPSPVSQPPVAQPPSPASGISPSSPSPAVSPLPPSPAPGVSPSSPAPAPVTTSPTPSPSANTPAYTPTSSPTPSPSANTPAYTPTSSPSPATSTPKASPPSPPVSTPSSGPSSSTTPGSSQTPSGSPGGSATPSSSNETSPPPGSAAWAVAPSSLLVYSVTFVIGAALSEILGTQ